jgi:hypothetical protein
MEAAALPPDPAARGMAFVIVGVLAGLVFTNVAQLPRMELSDQGPPVSVYRRSVSADAAEIGLDAGSTIRRRQGLFLELRIHAPDVEIYVPARSPLNTYQLYGLGRVRQVVEVDYDPERFAADVDIVDFVVADDADGRYGPFPFSIALAEGPPAALALRRSDDRVELIDLRLVPPAEREVLGR